MIPVVIKIHLKLKAAQLPVSYIFFFIFLYITQKKNYFWSSLFWTEKELQQSFFLSGTKVTLPLKAI